MRGMPLMVAKLFGMGKILAMIAVIIFVLATFGVWPDSLAEDVDPVALGLAFLAASFVLP
jgi:hypothetical protein